MPPWAGTSSVHLCGHRCLSALVGQVEKQRIAEAGTKFLERGYLLVFEALQIPTNEGSPRIQQSKMMLSQR